MWGSSAITVAGTPVPLPVVVAVVGGAVALLLLVLRRLVYPKPLPGIPYNKEASKRILGDIPGMLQSRYRRQWFFEQAIKHNSPIVQVFVRPFGHPWVLLTDFHESQDICQRRLKEFERSSISYENFVGVGPDHHIIMKSSDPRFKRNRELTRDLMTPAFLNEVSAPQIYDKVSELLDLWRQKTQLAKGRPFRADQDIYTMSIDIIMAVAFGLDESRMMLRKSIRELNSTTHFNVPGKDDDAFAFKPTELDAELAALITITESLGVAFRSPVPIIAHWIHRQKPFMKRAIAHKEKLTSEQIEKAVKRLKAEGYSDSNLRSAMDSMLLRERSKAKKENREPVWHSRTIYDELFGYILGGHDTTATTLAWTVKFLGRYQNPQTRVREALHAAFPDALKDGRLPTVAEITKSHIPWLDAFIEESIRHAKTLPLTTREATCDTQILGVPIPKGTTIMIASHGPSYLMPPIGVDDKLRTDSSRRSTQRFANWDEDTVGQFLPERWLKLEKNKEGQEEVVFDANAGPFMAFGTGPRGCFGRRLAYVEMRICITLLIWNFELLKLSDNLDTVDWVEKMTSMPLDCYVKLVPLNT